MKENEKVRVYLCERPGKGYGARTQCEEAMKRLSDVFSAGALLRYGLSRNASTFEDLMRGGPISVRKYQAEIEKQLPVKSKVLFIADKAKASVSEAVGELEAYIRILQKTMRVADNCALYLQPEHIRFDDGLNKVVWSPEGLEAIEDVEGYYMTNEKQVQVNELAKEIAEKIDDLNKLLSGSHYCAISNDMGNGILAVSNGGKIKVEFERVAGILA